MPVKQSVAVIVDAYSTGRYFAKEFSEKGYNSVHIQSCNPVPGFCRDSFRPDDFIENFIFSGNTDEIVSTLEKYNPLCIIPGCELGVSLADKLTVKFNVVRNDILLSNARRNKYEMIERIKSRKLDVPNQIRSNNFKEAEKWLDQNTYSKIVLKPLESAGTDNVYICEKKTDLQNIFSKIIGSQSRLNTTNNELLIQEYLEGVEYIVNSVSYDGNHFVLEYWKCHKKEFYVDSSQVRIYDVEVLLPRYGEVQNQLEKYVKQVLDALSIEYGPTHAEIMLTARGPVLIEIASRPQGGVNTEAIKECLGTDQISLTVEAYTNPGQFHEFSKKPLNLKKGAYVISLISDQEGLIKEIPLLSEVQLMKSFYSLSMNVSKGSILTRTIDLFTSPGTLYLIHEDLELLESEYLKVREIERNGYVLENENL